MGRKGRDEGEEEMRCDYIKEKSVLRTWVVLPIVFIGYGDSEVIRRHTQIHKIFAGAKNTLYKKNPTYFVIMSYDHKQDITITA